MAYENSWKKSYMVGSIKLTAHPLAVAFPRMTEEEWDNFFEDVSANGLVDNTIIVDKNNRVLDGWSRTRAVSEACLGEQAIILEVFQGSDEDARQFVISRNLHRRHLTTSQRAMIAAEIASMDRSGSAKIKHHGSEGSAPTAKQAAKQMKVSERQVHLAKKVAAKATPKQVEDIKAGKTTVGAVAKKVLPPSPKRKGLPVAKPTTLNPLDGVAAALDVALGEMGEDVPDLAATSPEPASSDSTSLPSGETEPTGVEDQGEGLYDHFFRQAREAITMMAVLSTYDKACMDVIDFTDPELGNVLTKVRKLAEEHAE